MIDPTQLAQANLAVQQGRLAVVVAQQQFNDAQTALQTLQINDQIAATQATLITLKNGGGVLTPAVAVAPGG